MANHIPDVIQILTYADDGEDARHYRFRLSQQTQHNPWPGTRPGQFFMLNVPGTGEAPFTFTSPPDSDGEFSAFIRKMGQVTGALFKLKPGDILGARGPFGRGWPMQELSGKHIVLLAGGCGLAPLVNVIDTLIDQQISPPAEIALIYGARNPDAQMLTPQRLSWQHKIHLFNTFDELPDDYETGNGKYPQLLNSCRGTPLDILPEVLANFARPPAIALLCGPEQMMQAAATELVDYGLDAGAIFLSVERRMHCALGLCGHCYLKHVYACKQGPTFSWQALQPLL